MYRHNLLAPSFFLHSRITVGNQCPNLKFVCESFLPSFCPGRFRGHNGSRGLVWRLQNVNDKGGRSLLFLWPEVTSELATTQEGRVFGWRGPTDTQRSCAREETATRSLLNTNLVILNHFYRRSWLHAPDLFVDSFLKELQEKRRIQFLSNRLIRYL